MAPGKEWRCAFCCHVRTGTIVLGVVHLMLHVMALSIIAVVLMHPELLAQQGDGMDQPAELNLEGEMEGSEGKLCDYQSEYVLLKDRKWAARDIYIVLFATLCSFAVSLLMVYGAIKGIPSYLLPFLCLLGFDFFVACITVLGSVASVGDIRAILDTWSTLPYHHQLLQLSPQWLGIIILVSSILAMMLKAYLILVVWRCYKYLLKMKKEGGLTPGDSDSQMLLPPDYETATKDSSFVPVYSTPPPPYSPQTAASMAAAAAAAAASASSSETVTIADETEAVRT